MKIAIVEDDRETFEHIGKCLSELLENTAELHYFANGEAFLAAWQPGAFDFIMLDIFMGKQTGVEVAREIRKRDQTVKLSFSTSSNEYASESYEVNACYYLHKPFGKEQLKAMLDRLNLSEIEKQRTAKLPGGTSVVLRSILYADCTAHCTTLHTKDGSDPVVRANFSEIENILCAYPYFFTPTKGVIVNFCEVTAQNRDTFTMSNGAIIPISRRKAKDAQDAYSSFLFEKLRRGGEY